MPYGPDGDWRSPELETFYQAGMPTSTGMTVSSIESSDPNFMSNYRDWLGPIRFPMDNTHGILLSIIGLDVENQGSNKGSSFLNATGVAIGGELTNVETASGSAKALGEFQTNVLTPGLNFLKSADAYVAPSPLVKGAIAGANATELSKQSTSVINAALSSTPRPIKNIVLPIPNDIKVQYEANWNNESVMPIQYALRNVLNGQKESDAAKLLVATTEEWALGSTLGAFGGLANTTKGMLLAGGVAFNPYRQLMYDAPSFRSFQFSWILSPKNITESNTINEIVWYLKKHMHPNTLGKSAQGSMFWLNPDYLDCTFILKGATKDSRNTWLPMIKRAVIKSVSVSYESKFHKGGAPAAISLTLDILETVLLTQNDFITKNETA